MSELKPMQIYSKKKKLGKAVFPSSKFEGYGEEDMEAPVKQVGTPLKSLPKMPKGSEAKLDRPQEWEEYDKKAEETLKQLKLEKMIKKSKKK